MMCSSRYALMSLGLRLLALDWAGHLTRAVLRQDLVAQRDALVADVNLGAGDQLADLDRFLAAEGAT
jgi:hypothetical protein